VELLDFWIARLTLGVLAVDKYLDGGLGLVLGDLTITGESLPYRVLIKFVDANLRHSQILVEFLDERGFDLLEHGEISLHHDQVEALLCEVSAEHLACSGRSAIHDGRVRHLAHALLRLGTRFQVLFGIAQRLKVSSRALDQVVSGLKSVPRDAARPHIEEEKINPGIFKVN